MELNKCDFLSSLGLKHIQQDVNGIRQVPSSNLEYSPSKSKKKRNRNSKKKFKFNSFICSFPITIVNENSYLSRKFYKEFKQPKLDEIHEYEKFCQTKITSSEKTQSLSTSHEKISTGNFICSKV